MQVHNLGDVPTQLAILKEQKQQGRIRYIGVTTTFDQQYQQIIDIMRRMSQTSFKVFSSKSSSSLLVPLLTNTINPTEFGKFSIAQTFIGHIPNTRRNTFQSIS